MFFMHLSKFKFAFLKFLSSVFFAVFKLTGLTLLQSDSAHHIRPLLMTWLVVIHLTRDEHGGRVASGHTRRDLLQASAF